jgi:acylphosphatase
LDADVIDTVRQRAVVRGRVQGVFFRETTRRAATAAGVAGWVRNLPDGAVEAVFEGDPTAVTELVAFCLVGPPDAVVDGVEVFDEPPEGLVGFATKATPPRQ